MDESNFLYNKKSFKVSLLSLSLIFCFSCVSNNEIIKTRLNITNSNTEIILINLRTQSYYHEFLLDTSNAVLKKVLTGKIDYENKDCNTSIYTQISPECSRSDIYTNMYKQKLMDCFVGKWSDIYHTKLKEDERLLDYACSPDFENIALLIYDSRLFPLPWECCACISCLSGHPIRHHNYYLRIYSIGGELKYSEKIFDERHPDVKGSLVWAVAPPDIYKDAQ